MLKPIFSFRLNGLILGLMMVMSSFKTATSQEKQDLPEATQLLDALGTAIEAIKSFEVYVQVKREDYFTEGVFDIEKQQFRPELKTFSPPNVSWARSRQLFSGGRRRIEVLDPKSDEVLQILAGDNETERSLTVKSQRGGVQRAGGKGIEWGHDYQETFRMLCDGITIMHVFRQRSKQLVARREGPYVCLEVEPMSGVTNGPRGFRVYADPDANFLPAKTEIFEIIEGERRTTTRMTVTERKKIASGVAVPVKAITEFISTYKGFGNYQQANHKKELVVDVARSHWNEKISEEAFRVPFQAGVFVSDKIRNVAYVVGKPDPGKNLDELAANSKIVARNIFPAVPSPPSRGWLWWTISVISIAIFFILGFLHYRRRSVKAAI